MNFRSFFSAVKKFFGRIPRGAVTAIICVISAAVFMLAAVGTFKKAGSDAYKNHSSFDSYTKQAMAWRSGEAKLDKNYPHLELAIVNRDWLAAHDKSDYMAYRETFGDVGAPIQHVEGSEYYVSFPPVPSVPLYLISFITGSETPDNLLSILYVAGALVFAILIMRRLGYGAIISVLAGFFVGAGSGAYFLSVNKYPGGPWFAAQTLALLLTMAALYTALSPRKAGLYISFPLLALAVGCRPFQIVYFIYLAYLAARRHSFRILRTWSYYIAPAVIGGTYMWYNYIRFGKLFEFGHNYLPEFMRDPIGQFSLKFISSNARSFFRIFPSYSDGKLEFSKFGFCFYVANPLFIFAALCLAAALSRIFVKRAVLPDRTARQAGKGVISADTDNLIQVFGLAVLCGIHLLLLLMHKTNGGWQFGMRYTVDIVPAALVMAAVAMHPFFTGFDADVLPTIFGAVASSGDGWELQSLSSGTLSRAPSVYYRFYYSIRGAAGLAFTVLFAFGCWLNITGAYMMLK